MRQRLIDPNWNLGAQVASFQVVCIVLDYTNPFDRSGLDVPCVYIWDLFESHIPPRELTVGDCSFKLIALCSPKVPIQRR